MHILRITRGPGSASAVIDSCEGRCPFCGGSLEGAITCVFAEVPEGAGEAISSPPVVRFASSRQKVVFQPASSYMRFSLASTSLDELLQPLVPGRLILLTGREAATVAELAAFRAQLPSERGGLDSTVLFVDGGNCSDPYLFSSDAKWHGVNPQQALRRVVTTRAFTMYQLADLISYRLKAAVDDYAARLVVISDLLGTFNEPETDEGEAKRLLEAAAKGMAEMKKKTLVIATLPAPSRFDRQVLAGGDSIVNFSPSDLAGRVHAVLAKHPTKGNITRELETSDLLTPSQIGVVL